MITVIMMNDYDYDYDYTELNLCDYDYDYDYSKKCNWLYLITIAIIINPRSDSVSMYHLFYIKRERDYYSIPLSIL